MTHTYVKMCPRCRVPILWLAEWDEEKDGKAFIFRSSGGKCRRCRRGEVGYIPVPSGCLLVWEVHGEPLHWE